MQARIRKTDNLDKYPLRWQPEDSRSKKWYGINYKNVIAKTIEANLIRGETLFAIGQGLSVIVRAVYCRETHNLTVLEPKGSD